jgi:hypothetical protein
MDKDILQFEIEKLVSANKTLCEEIMKIGELEDLELLQDKLSETIHQLTFWVEQNNEDRFFYELKKYTEWVINNYS